MCYVGIKSLDNGFGVNLDKFHCVQSAILKMITLPILPPKLPVLKHINVSNLDIFDT